MAGVWEEQPYHDDVDDASVDVDTDLDPSPPKRPKNQCEKALLSLIAFQQDQLAKLSENSNMATWPTPNTTPSPATGASAQLLMSTSSFRLAEFDADASSYSIEEWLEDASKLKEELCVGDVLMIVKAGEALKGRAHRYYCAWRPVRRTWENFCKDLVIAFPDRETTGARAYSAATLRSRDCDSLCDYGVRKLRLINRFCDDLSWNTIASMIEYGLDHTEAQASIRIQQPRSDRELLKLLSECDARRIKHRIVPSLRSADASANNITKSRDLQRNFPSTSLAAKGACFNCGRTRHRQVECRFPPRDKDDHKSGQARKTREDGSPCCSYCKRAGHLEKNCWSKHGKSEKIMLIRRGHSPATSPVATLLCNNEAMRFTYTIDSGADVSILRKSTANTLKVSIQPEVRVLCGLSANNVYSIGTSTLIAVLPNATEEVLFRIVPDEAIPAKLDAIIGWDVIGLPHLKVIKGANGLELHHDQLNIFNVHAAANNSSLKNVNLSGLDERYLLWKKGKRTTVAAHEELRRWPDSGEY